jgi:hypothetical protein
MNFLDLGMLTVFPNPLSTNGDIFSAGLGDPIDLLKQNTSKK